MTTTAVSRIGSTGRCSGEILFGYTAKTNEMVPSLKRSCWKQIGSQMVLGSSSIADTSVEVADALYSSILVYDEPPLPLCLPNKLLQMIEQLNFYIKAYVASQR